MTTTNPELYQPRENPVTNPPTESVQPATALDLFRQNFYSQPTQLALAVVRPRDNAPPAQNNDAPAPVQPAQQPEVPQVPAPAAPGQAGQLREVGNIVQDMRAERTRQELAQLPQQLQTDVVRWVGQLGSANAQERTDAIARLRENPQAANLAFRAALLEPTHPVHQLMNQLTSGDASVQSNAMAALRPFGDLVNRQMAELLKNHPNSDFVQGLNRLVGDLGSANAQDRNSQGRHNDASRALEQLRMIAPGVVDRAVEQQLADPNSAMSRMANNLITALGSTVYREREFATQALAHLGTPVLPLLQRTIPTPDLEVQRRVEQLLERIPQQQTNRVIEAMTRAGTEALPRTGNAEQDQALQRRFRDMVEGVFHANPSMMVGALGQYNEFINQWGKWQRSFQPNAAAEWSTMATALQRAFDSDPRTRGMIARVTPQGNFIVGHDQNDAQPGSSLMLVDRSMTFNFPLSHRTVPLPQQRPGEPVQTMPPPPQNAQEAMRDLFVDPFGEGMAQLHRTQVQLPVPPGFGVIPATIQIPHWGPYQSRRQQWFEQTYGSTRKARS